MPLGGTIIIVVRGDPVPKARPRAAVVRGTARIYTPKTSRDYEDKVRLAARRAIDGRAPLEGAIALRLELILAVPASWPKSKRAAAFAGRLLPASRPDADNFAKAILDGMNGIVFHDDAQITDLTITKRYGAEPQAIARIAPILTQTEDARRAA